MNNIDDIPKAVDSLAKFGTKFLEVIDTFFNESPRAIKRKSKAINEAKADEIKLVTEAIRNNPDCSITYKNGDFSIDGYAHDDILARSQKRVVNQILKEQVNIDNIVQAAYAQIENKDEVVSSNPVDDGWITRFFKYAGEISSEEVQALWGSILSGEVKQPGSCSLRALDVLRNLSQKEAELFQKVSSLAIQNASTNIKYHYIYNKTELLRTFGVDVLDIVTLADIGLLSEGLFITFKDIEQVRLFAKYNIWIIFIAGEPDKVVNIPIIKYTTVGEELLSIINPKYKNMEYFKEIQKDLSKNKVKLSYAELENDIDQDGKYTYKNPVAHL